MEDAMQIKKKLYNNTLYIMLCGELDEYTANYTRQILDKIIKESVFNKLIYDLSGLEFMDSTGIGVLIGRYKILKNKNKSIYITNANSQIERIFNMSGLYEIMPKIS